MNASAKVIGKDATGGRKAGQNGRKNRSGAGGGTGA
jgi:hypothetical protein